MRIVTVTAHLIGRPETTIALFLAVLLFYKVRLMRPVAVGPLFLAVLQHDAAILALILLLWAAGSAAARRSDRTGTARVVATILSKLCIAISLAIVFLYAADAFAFYFFGTRLYASDIATFSFEPRAALSLLRSGWRVMNGHRAWKLAIIVAILLLLRACFMLLAKPERLLLRGRYLMVAAVSLAILWQIQIPGHIHAVGNKVLYENFIERNKNFFVHSNFSDEFRAKVLASPPAETCMAGRSRRVNVILLIVESLSAYQSHYFSGVEDWTPRLDEIAQRETSLPNFYANGWTTIGGLLSLLDHTFPFVPEHTQYNKSGSPRFTDFLDIPNPLPRELAKQGYATEFVAAGDLGFMGQESWLRTIGFQKLIGDSDPRYVPQKVRGPFNSVPDRVLYNVAMAEVGQMRKDKPYFMTVQTFWSHRPFTDPNGGTLDGEESVIRETDAQIGSFYQQLMAAGFFQNGLLFITGDHRAVEPYRKAEFDRFGTLAVARIPAVIVTRAIDLPRVSTQDFQQRDFSASIESLVGVQYCLGPQEGTFLSDPPKPASCIMHSRGSDRDLILVKCGAKQATILVSGDSTRVESGAVDDEASVIQTVNRTRARPVN